MHVISNAVLANGLQADFINTYTDLMNYLPSTHLARVMEVPGIGVDNRQKEFAFFKLPPHMDLWPRSQAIPQGTMEAVRFPGVVYTWGRRIPWHNEDRKDDQTGSLTQVARACGESAALLPERFFFDALLGATTTLPAIPKAADGSSIFATTAGGVDRYGVSGGNIISGTGVGSVSAILTDYYALIQRWRAMRLQGQPMLADNIIDGGVTILHGSTNEQVFEEAFYQKRQSIVVGTDAGTTPTNIIHDTNRKVKLWSTSRITDNSWYAFLDAAPMKPFHYLDREGVQEMTSNFDQSGGDISKTTGEEYVQWSLRSGIIAGETYMAMKVSN